MLKKAPNYVLGEKNPQRTPEGTPAVFSSPAALLDSLFEHPAQLLSRRSSSLARQFKERPVPVFV
jgi:hypothetical protein